MRPTRAAFVASRDPLRAVLEDLRPERIWVAGKGVWDGIWPIDREDVLHADVQALRLKDGTRVWTLATKHPRLFNWRTAYPLLMAFLCDPQKAAVMLHAA
jgi:hypothetical protein